MMKKISQFNKIMGEMAGWIVVLMMLTISLDVAMRYLFDAPTTWSFEVNRYMLIMVVFLGGPWTLTAGGHVRVDLLTESLSKKRKLTLDIVTSVMACAYMLLFTWQSMIFTWDAWENGVRSTEYLAWPLWPIRMFLFVGGALLAIQYVIKIIDDTVQLKSMKLKTIKGAA